MENNLKSIVYMTVNTVNNKIYVGVHITETPYEFDNYWGNGVTGTSSYHFKHPKNPFQKACKKYGLNAFKRYTLFVFDSYEDALEMERKIVNEEFIKRSDTYNVALGGGSGLVPSTEIEAHQYDLSGNYIKSYRSYSDAGRKNNVSYVSIGHAILNKSICVNSYWSETRVSKLDISLFKSPMKPIYVYDHSGKYLGEESSITNYAKRYEVCLSSAQKALKYGTKCAGNYISTEKVEVFKIREYKRNRKHKIYQYNSKGEFIKMFENQSLVRQELKKPMTRLSMHIIDQTLYEGFYWSYERYDKFPKKQNVSKKIAQYDLSGNLVKIWNTYRECNKEFSNLRYVLSGVRSQTKGFIFKYVD